MLQLIRVVEKSLLQDVNRFISGAVSEVSKLWAKITIRDERYYFEQPGSVTTTSATYVPAMTREVMLKGGTYRISWACMADTGAAAVGSWPAYATRLNSGDVVAEDWFLAGPLLTLSGFAERTLNPGSLRVDLLFRTPGGNVVAIDPRICIERVE